MIVGQTFLAGSTDPTKGSTPWSLTSHGVSEKLFTVDQDDNIIGQVAKSVSKVSALVWEVVLKPGYKFSDGTAVTAAHVAKCLSELNEKNSAAKSSLGEMTVTAEGDLKVRIESTRPTHVMDAVLAEWVFVVYLKDAQGKFVFTGPYAIKTLTAGQIDLVPNKYYNKASERSSITIKKFADGHKLAEGVKNKQVDIGFHLPIDTLPELRKLKGIHVESFEVGYHYMVFHNTDRLKDVRVRKAIDLAIDRSALVKALAGGRATRSLFPDYSPYFSDKSSPVGDASAAKALLDAAGWKVGSTGKRMKDGKVLNVNLVAYPHRPGLGIMQPLIDEALTGLGINVTTILTSHDWSETAKIINDRSFDLLMWAQHTLPAGDPLWFLNAFFRSDGGNNHANFNSSTVDSLLDKLSVAEEHSARVAATGAAQEAILAQVPVSNLVTPFWHVSVSDRVGDYQPWGSDYYVIRADLFVEKAKPKPKPSTTLVPVNKDVGSCKEEELDFIVLKGDVVAKNIEDDVRKNLEVS